MPFFYQSGQEIRPGDRVLIHGETGEIEFIADPAEISYASGGRGLRVEEAVRQFGSPVGKGVACFDGAGMSRLTPRDARTREPEDGLGCSLIDFLSPLGSQGQPVHRFWASVSGI